MTPAHTLAQHPDWTLTTMLATHAQLAEFIALSIPILVSLLAVAGLIAQLVTSFRPLSPYGWVSLFGGVLIWNTIGCYLVDDTKLGLTYYLISPTLYNVILGYLHFSLAPIFKYLIFV